MASTGTTLVMPPRQSGRAATPPLRPLPGISAPAVKGGNYPIGRPQVARSKLLDLADALKHVRPAMADVSAIAKMKDEAAFREGAIEYRKDPSQFDAYIDALGKDLTVTRRRIRKLVASGKMPEEANPARILGALQARGVDLVRSDYRGTLMDAEALMTDDPEEYINDQRKDFMGRAEFRNRIIAETALKEMSRVEDDFRGAVNDRILRREIEEGKAAWKNDFRRILPRIMEGELTLNGPESMTFINHDAGMYKGANEDVFNNVIRPHLLDGLMTVRTFPATPTQPQWTGTRYTIDQTLNFLAELQEWDLGGGVKFADDKVGNLIIATQQTIEGRRSMQNEARHRARVEGEEALLGGWIALFEKEFETNGKVGIDLYTRAAEDVLAKFPSHQHEKATKALREHWKGLNGMIKGADGLNHASYLELEEDIEGGANLDGKAQEIRNAVAAGDISGTQAVGLHGRLALSRDFDEQVLKLDTYKNLSKAYDDVIKGALAMGVPAYLQAAPRVEASWFSEQTNADGVELWTLMKEHHPLGEVGADLYKEQRAEVFRRMALMELKSRFFQKKTWGAGDPSPDDRVRQIEEEMDKTLEAVFKDWEASTHSDARTRFNFTPATP